MRARHGPSNPALSPLCCCGCPQVIFDPSWNPAHDLQAQDRAFRLGQRRDVGVYRLVATGTLEEAVYRRQIYKQQQANMSVAGTREKRFFKGVQVGLPPSLGMKLGCVLCAFVLITLSGGTASPACVKP